MPAQTAPRLSVVIRCRNEAASLARLFAALRAQQTEFCWETIVVDNESKDDTVARAEAFGARVVAISTVEFTYGRALNRGIAAARGELVLLISAHVLPIGRRFLEAAVTAFGDPQVAAARCLWVGHPGQLQKWFEPEDIGINGSAVLPPPFSPAWLQLLPVNGCAVIRRSVWEQVPYDEALEFSEDKAWANAVLARGYRIRCCADAVWMYTRRYSRTEQWRRDLRQAVAVYRMTNQAPLSVWGFASLTVRSVLRHIYLCVRRIGEDLVWNALLLTVPRRARRPAAAGSHPEFSRK